MKGNFESRALNYLFLLVESIVLHMSLIPQNVMLENNNIKVWLLVSSISQSGKDACGCSYGKQESPRSRISCSSHLSAHTSAFFQVQHSDQAWQTCKEQDQENSEFSWHHAADDFYLFVADFVCPFKLPVFYARS